MNQRSGSQWMRYLQSQEGTERLAHLYGRLAGLAARRYEQLIRRHQVSCGEQADMWLVSAPGRSEIGGNHTDHNHGCVLAAGINLDTIAAVTLTHDGIITMDSEGYAPIHVDTADLAPKEAERGHTAAIVRGIAARMRELGYVVGGFYATVSSNVLGGSGLSSSAAIEVLTAAMLDVAYNAWTLPGLLRAQIAQYAENVYFGKPCGLMDQAASSLGGLVNIDFGGAEPVARRLQYDFAAKGYAVCVVNTGGNHGDLTENYAAIRREMEQVAAYFGKQTLRDVPEEHVERSVAALCEKVGDRAVLRAFHFYDDNRRVAEQVAALEADDLEAFLQRIIASGYSSWMLLQNIWASASEQKMAVALALSQRVLAGRGAWRVHGGGFAGTILAFVPSDLLADYTQRLNAVFGEHACTVLDIRPEGAVCLG